MSSITTDVSNINTNISIHYNYSDVTVNKNLIQRNQYNQVYLQVPFMSSGSSSTNFTIKDIQNKQYQSTYLYIRKSQNLITDISYDAEIIIEHVPMTNDRSNKLYTCFLLQCNTNNPSTELSKTINNLLSTNNNDTITLSLQQDISSSKIYYKDTADNTVVIIKTPIKINIELPENTTTTCVLNLFSLSPKNNTTYSIIPTSTEAFTTTIEGFTSRIVEGLTQTAYCQPIDMIDASGSEDANLTIPLTGAYTPNSATSSITRTAINFMSFVMVLLFTYVMVPIIYNDYIIGLITMTGQNKMNRIRSIDVYICFVFIMAAFALISQGINKNNQNSTIIGFFVGLFFVIGFVTIQTKKIDSTWFLKNFPDGSDSNTLYSHISILDDFIKFIYENITIFISNIFMGAIIGFLLVGFGYITGSFKPGGLLATGDGVIYLVLFTVYLTIAVSQYTPK